MLSGGVRACTERLITPPGARTNIYILLHSQAQNQAHELGLQRVHDAVSPDPVMQPHGDSQPPLLAHPRSPGPPPALQPPEARVGGVDAGEVVGRVAPGVVLHPLGGEDAGGGAELGGGAVEVGHADAVQGGPARVRSPRRDVRAQAQFHRERERVERGVVPVPREVQAPVDRRARAVRVPVDRAAVVRGDRVHRCFFY